MYLHVRKAANANSLVVTFRESYREGKVVKKRQHHVASVPLDLGGRQERDRRYGHHASWFWMAFDQACEKFEVTAKDKRAFERRVRAEGAPRRPRQPK